MPAFLSDIDPTALVNAKAIRNDTAADGAEDFAARWTNDVHVAGWNKESAAAQHRFKSTRHFVTDGIAE